MLSVSPGPCRGSPLNSSKKSAVVRSSVIDPDPLTLSSPQRPRGRQEAYPSPVERDREIDGLPSKVVGRRREGAPTLDAAQTLQQTFWALRGGVG